MIDHKRRLDSDFQVKQALMKVLVTRVVLGNEADVMVSVQDHDVTLGRYMAELIDFDSECHHIYNELKKAFELRQEESFIKQAEIQLWFGEKCRTYTKLKNIKEHHDEVQ